MNRAAYVGTESKSVTLAAWNFGTDATLHLLLGPEHFVFFFESVAPSKIIYWRP